MRRNKIPPKKCICGAKYQVSFSHPYCAELKCSKCNNFQMLDEETTEYLKKLRDKKIKKAQLKIKKMFN